jgi:hypothetical protein
MNVCGIAMGLKLFSFWPVPLNFKFNLFNGAKQRSKERNLQEKDACCHLCTPICDAHIGARTNLRQKKWLATNVSNQAVDG